LRTIFQLAPFFYFNGLGRLLIVSVFFLRD
jgi:hypothetical protein